MSWTKCMAISKQDIKKKICWYEKHKEQKDLDEWVEGDGE